MATSCQAACVSFVCGPAQLDTGTAGSWLCAGFCCCLLVLLGISLGIGAAGACARTVPMLLASTWYILVLLCLCTKCGSCFSSSTDVLVADVAQSPCATGEFRQQLPPFLYFMSASGVQYVSIRCSVSIVDAVVDAACLGRGCTSTANPACDPLLREAARPPLLSPVAVACLCVLTPCHPLTSVLDSMCVDKKRGLQPAATILLVL